MDKLRYMALHTVGAAVFIFVLNFLILGTSLQTALIWAIGFATWPSCSRVSTRCVSSYVCA